MFVGRTEELEKLEDTYSREGSWTYALYGRRRVGKSSLLRRFCEGKPNLFVTATGINARLNLENLSVQISRSLGREVKLNNIWDLIDVLKSIDSDEKTVIVIDEYPELVKVSPETSPLLQMYIDHDMGSQNVMLILCGSSMSAMGNELNDYGAPLFGRFPLQMKVLPLPYREARKLNPGLKEEDRIRIYSIASGIPYYHITFGDGVPDEGIRRNFLGSSPMMALETDNILSMELKPSDTYRSIISLLHGGETIPRIVNITGLSERTCIKALENLMTLGFVKKEVCFGTKKKSRYKLDDGMMDFRYGVLSRFEGRIIDKTSDDAFSEIKTEIDTFYGPRFEDVCRQYVISTESFKTIGNWWGAVPIRRDGMFIRGDDGKVVTEDVDIDIVATVKRDRGTTLLLGECKFTRFPVGIKELETLIQRGQAIKEYPDDRAYIIFSRSGFTDGLIDHLDAYPDLDVRLVGMDDIRSWAETDSLISDT